MDFQIHIILHFYCDLCTHLQYFSRCLKVMISSLIWTPDLLFWFIKRYVQMYCVITSEHLMVLKNMSVPTIHSSVCLEHVYATLTASLGDSGVKKPLVHLILLSLYSFLSARRISSREYFVPKLSVERRSRRTLDEILSWSKLLLGVRINSYSSTPIVRVSMKFHPSDRGKPSVQQGWSPKIKGYSRMWRLAKDTARTGFVPSFSVPDWHCDGWMTFTNDPLPLDRDFLFLAPNTLKKLNNRLFCLCLCSEVMSSSFDVHMGGVYKTLLCCVHRWRPIFCSHTCEKR